MPFKIFGPKEEKTDEYVEVNALEQDIGVQRTGKLSIQVEKLDDFADTERILKSVRDGNIVFLKIKSLKEKDIGELKRAVDRLRKSVVANSGDIAGVEQDWLILTPEYADITR